MTPNETMLFQRVTELEAENARLKAENKKLSWNSIDIEALQKAIRESPPPDVPRVSMINFLEAIKEVKQLKEIAFPTGK